MVSCITPTLVQDKDCSGDIGGQAIVDDCGYCTGGTTTLVFNQYMGCDSTCQGTQIDCLGQCGGDTTTDCNGTCGGNSFIDYFCKENENGTFNLDSLSLECFAENESGNCRPNTSSCLYIDCTSDTIYNNTVIDCNFNLPNCDQDSGTCDNYNDWLSNSECDFTLTNCEEFNFDGGDCNLIDCSGLHFSEELCVSNFGQGCTEGDDSSLGDGFCDDGNDDVLPVNFNCEKWGFDGAECICEDGNNNEYDCWDKESVGNYDCPIEGRVRGGIVLIK